MSFFSFLTGSGDAAEKTLDIGGKLLDNAFYTKQEKAETNNKILDWYLKYQLATAGQNVARRVIAFMVVGLWIFLILLGVCVRGLEATHGDDSYSKFIFNVLTEIVGTPFAIIMGFYYIKHIVQGAKNG